MKIALVTRRYPPMIGGAERVLGYLAPALVAEGADVTVLTAHAPGLPRLEEGPGGVRVVRMATSRARFVGTWLYMNGLNRFFAREQVDLAYVSMLKHDAYATVAAGRRHRFPVVLRPEGAGLTGDLAWQGWGRFGRAIGQRCRQADGFVAISAATRGELVAAGYDPARVHDLPNGVPVPDQLWQPAPRAVPRHAAFVGRLAPEKGLDALVDAWPIVLGNRPDARLTLIGDGPSRPGLEARIAGLGLAGSIRLNGAAPDPAEVLRDCDLFVLPSREEGMSIALLEAMAWGLPVVASLIPGNAALISDGVHGRLARARRPGRPRPRDPGPVGRPARLDRDGPGRTASRG